MDISAFGNVDFDKEAKKITLNLVHGKHQETFFVEIFISNSEGEIIERKKAISTSPKGAEYISLIYLEELGFEAERFEELNRKFIKTEFGNDVEAVFYDNSLPNGGVLLSKSILTPFEKGTVNG